MKQARKAVFLDRDGVLNKLVLNPATRAYESPHRPEDLVFCAGIFGPLKELSRAGYLLFIVSNQPSYAKGKTTLKAIKETAGIFSGTLRKKGVLITASYYCHHHPAGLAPGYAKKCACRKPAPFFLLKARKRFGVDLRESWMIGDRDSDIECGRRAGCRTIAIQNPRSAGNRGKEQADFTAKDLKAAVKYILKAEERP